MSPECAAWISFMGSLVGALLAGVIALIVMWRTNKNNNRINIELLKDKYCNEILDLIANYCVHVSFIAVYLKAKYEKGSYNQDELNRHIENLNIIGYKLDLILTPNSHSKLLKEKILEIKELIEDSNGYSDILQKMSTETKILRKMFYEYIEIYKKN